METGIYFKEVDLSTAVPQGRNIKFLDLDWKVGDHEQMLSRMNRGPHPVRVKRYGRYWSMYSASNQVPPSGLRCKTKREAKKRFKGPCIIRSTQQLVWIYGAPENRMTRPDPTQRSLVQRVQTDL